MKVFVCSLAVFAGLVIPAFADVPININGTFQPGPTPSGVIFDTIVAGGTIGGGGNPTWTVTDGSNDPGDGSVDWIGSYWNPPPATPGGYSVDLDGLNPGGIAQTITTTVGETYQLSFYLSANPDGPPDPKGLQVTAVVATGDSSANFSVPIGTSEPNLTWTAESIQFVASTNSTTIAFTSLDPATEGGLLPAYGPVVGGVTLTAVPEAGFYSYSLFAASMAGLLMFVRRKRLV